MTERSLRSGEDANHSIAPTSRILTADRLIELRDHWRNVADSPEAHDQMIIDCGDTVKIIEEVLAWRAGLLGGRR
jgi:hypothetical protein